MGMIRSDAEGPTPEQAAALKEAAESGSLSHPDRHQAKIAAFQERLRAEIPVVSVTISPAEELFQQDLETITQIADATSDPQIERLAKATRRALSFLAAKT